MATAVANDNGGSAYEDGIPASDPWTPSVAAAANGTYVFWSQGGDSDAGYATTWSGSAGGNTWTKMGEANLGGNASAGYWVPPTGSTNPPNPTINWVFRDDRHAGGWGSFSGVSGWDWAINATGTDGPIQPPQLQAARHMGPYDMWVVMTGHRDGTFSLPGGWTTAGYVNWKSRAGGVHYKVGEGESLYTPPEFSSVDVATQATVTIALYGTPPDGGGWGIGAGG